MDDDAIRSLLARLARPRTAGGATVERAAILAEPGFGTNFTDHMVKIDWFGDVEKGTGRWTVQSALDLGVPVSGIAEAVFARALAFAPT